MLRKIVSFTRPDQNGDREILLNETADGRFHVVSTGFDGNLVTTYNSRTFNDCDDARRYANRLAKKLVSDGWHMIKDSHTTYEAVRKTLTLLTDEQLAAIDEYTTALIKSGLTVSATALKALAEEMWERLD